MSERYVIYNLQKGWFQGLSDSAPSFSMDAFLEENACLYRTEVDAAKALSDMMVDYKNMRGAYKIEKIVFISL